MKEVMEGIYSHFNTVNTLNTALDGNLYPHEAEQGVSFPYGTYFIINDYLDYTFSEEQDEIQVQISVFSNDKSPVEINTLYGYVKDLFDEAEITVSGHSVLSFLRTDARPIRDAEHRTWAYHITYMVLIEKSRGR